MSTGHREDNSGKPDSASLEGIDSVLVEHLGTVSWSAEDGVAYEVALEGVHQVIGAYSGLIWRERSAPNPDNEAIAGWLEERRGWAARRQHLSPADREAVTNVRRECAALLASLDRR